MSTATHSTETSTNPYDQLIECCERCGIDRVRCAYYGDDCRGEDDGQWIGDKFVPGPSIGPHVFVTMTLRESIFGRTTTNGPDGAQ